MGLQAKMEKYTGQNYPYQSYIRTDEEMGISESGSVMDVIHNIGGLFAYTDILLRGDSKASKANYGPLGSKQIISTIAKCTDIDSGERKPRSLYINNVPSGKLNIADMKLPRMFSKGLIPGLINNITGLINPSKMFDVFTQETYPACKEITLETIDRNNNKSSGNAYLTIDDIEELQKYDMIPDTPKIEDLKNTAREKNIKGFRDDEKETETFQSLETKLLEEKLNELKMSANRLYEYTLNSKYDRDIQLFVLGVVLLYFYIYIRLVYYKR